VGTLRRRLLWLALINILLPSPVIMFMIAARAHSFASELIADEARAQLAAVNTLVDDFASQSSDAAASPDVRAAISLGDPDTARSFLSDYVARAGLAAACAVGTDDRVIACAPASSLAARTLSQESPLGAGQAGATFALLAGHLSMVSRSPVSLNGHRFADLLLATVVDQKTGARLQRMTGSTVVLVQRADPGQAASGGLLFGVDDTDVRAALDAVADGGSAQASLQAELGGEPFALEVAPLLQAGAPVGAIAIGRSVRAADARVQWFAQAMLISGLLALVAGVAITWSITRRLSQPIAELVASTTAAAGGDLSRQLDESGRDEVGELAAAFNAMSGQLRNLLHGLVDVTIEAREVTRAVEESARDTQKSAAAQEEGVRRSDAALAALDRIAQELVDNLVQLSGSVGGSVASVTQMDASVQTVGRRIVGLTQQGGRRGETIAQMATLLSRLAEEAASVRKDTQRTAGEADALALASKTTSEDAAEAERLSRENLGELTRANLAVQAMAGEMETMRAMQDEVSGTATGLMKEFSSILAVLGDIEDMADSSRLLALNATIIAAQVESNAFTVVADEMKDLASSTGRLAGEARALVARVTRRIDDTVQATSRGADKAAECRAGAVEAAAMLGPVHANTTAVAERVSGVALQMRSQQQISRDINALMERLVRSIGDIDEALRAQKSTNQRLLDALEETRRENEAVLRATREHEGASRHVRTGIDEVERRTSVAHELVGTQRTAVADVQRESVERNREADRSRRAAGRLVEVVGRLSATIERIESEVARFDLGQRDRAAVAEVPTRTNGRHRPLPMEVAKPSAPMNGTARPVDVMGDPS
jgi:methyl-accepting chemotaxis protein